MSHTVIRDYGKLGVSTTPVRVNFNQTFTGPPIVHATVTAEYGGDMVYVNVTNITNTGFTVALQENTLSGYNGLHFLEEVSWYAVSAISASEKVGATILNTEWKQITFDSAFGSVPKVFAFVQSENGADLVYADIRNRTVSGFEMRLEEPLPYDGTHTNETVGWIAFVTHPLGTVQSGTATGDSNWTPVSFPVAFADPPVLISDIVTENGSDQAIVDIRNLTGTGFEFRIEEDPFTHNVAHFDETVSWMAVTRTAPSSVFEKISLNHEWTYVPFMDVFENTPYVFADVSTESGSDTIEVDIRGVSPVGFSARIEEDTRGGWDGTHNLIETISITAVDPVVSPYDTGTVNLANNDTWVPVNFGGVYAQPPNVFAMIQTEFGGDTAEIDIRNVTTTGFEIRLEEDVLLGWDGFHASEQVAWMALDSTTPLTGQTGRLVIDQTVAKNQVWHNVTFPSPFSAVPNVLVEINSENGGHTVQADIRNLTVGGFQVRLEEEPNIYDGTHIPETVVWFANGNTYSITLSP
ncbi:MAG: H-type lectin domain protein [candidate division WS6 bacterium OLB20]|uniref:H-type lectin domain protein n=1 Tax=candidate division WS6 bacterium OLB20 TaxID=1617426 RepID=A0A136LZJ7_9BACT|nr:MAG: H-type lectin domain protein [candidate division WS6 bacterium OLB20]